MTIMQLCSFLIMSMTLIVWNLHSGMEQLVKMTTMLIVRVLIWMCRRYIILIRIQMLMLLCLLMVPIVLSVSVVFRPSIK